MQFAAKHIARLEYRANILETRIKTAKVKNLDDEKAELKTIRWVIMELSRPKNCRTYSSS